MPTPKASPQNRSTNGKGKYQSPLHGAPDEGKPQKVVTASQYKELKRRAFNFEKTNSDSIIIFPTKGDGTWYRMGGTSALLYMNFVMRPLHLSATYRDDTDYHYIFDLGTITVRNLDLIKKRIERAGVLKEMTSGGGSYRFGWPDRIPEFPKRHYGGKRLVDGPKAGSDHCRMQQRQGTTDRQRLERRPHSGDF